MPRLLQINVVNKILSTGKIAEDIARVATTSGWDCFIAFGRDSKSAQNNEIRIGNDVDVYAHYIHNILFDREGLASKHATLNLLDTIHDISPDVIHLHNIHDHYLNYPILINYVAVHDIPLVWTQHDCWAFTGGCMYFDMIGCDKWKNDCRICPQRRALFCNNSYYQFKKKQELLNRIRRLAFVPVSDWLAGIMYLSSQKDRLITTIHNGIDVELFRPIPSQMGNKGFNILGVASIWDKRKGLDDFIALRRLLPSDYHITLVGLSEKQIHSLPAGIKGLKRTTCMEELVSLYSNSDVFVNPTYSDNFPMTNIEALACGTPVITYNTGGSPEAIDNDTGLIINQGDVPDLAEAIVSVCSRGSGFYSSACRRRAEEYFDRKKCYKQYLDLYESLLVV